MISNKILPLFLLLFFTIALHADYEELPLTSMTPSPSLQKIYVNPLQVHMTSEGIFFLNEQGDLKTACGVFCDENGIYVLARYYQCPGCNRWNNNNICNNPDCMLYGK